MEPEGGGNHRAAGLAFHPSGNPAWAGRRSASAWWLAAGRFSVGGAWAALRILALGLGGRTYKLKFGHRGGNHPVFEERTGVVDITAQNHGFAVDPTSLTGKARVTHRSLFDGTVEGLDLPDARAFSVQYHPEASPGPTDARHIFHRFTRMMAGEPELSSR